MKKLAVISILLLILTLFLVIPAAAQLTLNPTHDVYIYSILPDATFDGDGSIADFSILPFCETNRRSFLQFDVSVIPTTVGPGTELRMEMVAAPEQAGGSVQLLSAKNFPGDMEDTVNGLTWSNQPAITRTVSLDIKPVPTISETIVFSGQAIADFINERRAAGNKVATFVVEWESCFGASPFGEVVAFEDRNPSHGGAPPVIVPLTPTAITLGSAEAESVRLPSALPIVATALVFATLSLATVYRKRRAKRA